MPRSTAVRRTRLPNGLTILMREVREEPLASIWCWYRVGSRDERPGLTGLSHWAEHMNFKGTRRIPKNEVTRRVELAGGLWNGYTWLDVTTYFETVDSGALEEMIRLEASRMHECLYPPDEIERERRVVISELQGGENDPRTFLDKEVTGMALQAHPYRWPTIGYLSDLRAITRDDLYAHYRRFYVPNNAILVLVGDFASADALRMARRHFGGIPRGADPQEIRTVEPPQEGERRVTLRRPSGATYLQRSYHAPAAIDNDFAILLVADAILSGPATINVWASGRGRGPSKSSRLYRAVVEGDLATDVGTSLIPTRHPFLYSVQATAKEGVDPARIEAAVDVEIERLARGDVGDDDLERARTQLFARQAMENESVTDIAHQLGFFETIARHDLPVRLARRVATVGRDDIARLARTRLAATRRTVGVLLPSPPAEAGPS